MKILLATTDGYFCDRIREQLKKFPDVTEIIQIKQLGELFILARQDKQFDVLFVEKRLLETPRKERYTEIIKLFSPGKVILVSGCERPYDVWTGFAFGVNGFLFTDEEWAFNPNVLRLILDGIPFIPPTIINDLPGRFKAGDSFVTSHKLTGRQIEALHCLAEGLSNREISRKMKVSEATVKLHINALLRRLNVENRTKAVVIAQQKGII